MYPTYTTMHYTKIFKKYNVKKINVYYNYSNKNLSTLKNVSNT